MSETVVDACCVINLCAIDDHRRWLQKLGLNWQVPSAVFAEAMYLNDTDEDGAPVKRPIDLQSLVDSGIFDLYNPVAEREKQRYVELASELDDGEAMALAIAECRGWLLATDDRKARRLAGQLNVAVITTPDIINLWVEKMSPSDLQVQAALRAIRDRARFLPAHSMPLYDWWMNHL